MRDQALKTTVAPQATFGHRLMGLAIVCVALFGMATLVGLFANGL